MTPLNLFEHIPKSGKRHAHLKLLLREQLEQPLNNTSILTTCNRKVTAEDWKGFKIQVRKKVQEEDLQKVYRAALSILLGISTLFLAGCLLSSLFTF